jgi:hypothetical protein
MRVCLNVGKNGEVVPGTVRDIMMSGCCHAWLAKTNSC